VTTTETRTISRYAPKASVKGEVSLKNIRARNLSGKELTPAELKSILSKSSYSLCLFAEPEKEMPLLDPFFANAFRNDQVIVYLDAINESLGSSMEPEETPASQNSSVTFAPIPPPAP